MSCLATLSGSNDLDCLNVQGLDDRLSIAELRDVAFELRGNGGDFLDRLVAESEEAPVEEVAGVHHRIDRVGIVVGMCVKRDVDSLLKGIEKPLPRTSLPCWRFPG